MTMKTLIPFKLTQNLLAGLLMVMLLSACGAAKTSLPVSSSAKTQNPLATKPVCVNIDVPNPTVKVGDVISVTGTMVNVTTPTYFGLEIRDEDADDSSMMINVLSRPPLKAADVSQIVKMVSVDYTDQKVVLGLQAVKVGSTTIDFFLSAEDFCGTHLGNGVSPKIKITVNP